MSHDHVLQTWSPTCKSKNDMHDDTLPPWLVESLVSTVSVLSCKKSRWPDSFNPLLLLGLFNVNQVLQGKQPLNWPLHSGRSSTLYNTDNLDYSSSNAIVSTRDQLLYLAKFPLLRSRLSSKTVTTSLTDTAAMLNLGLVFCRYRFLNSVTQSLLQGLQKCSSSNPSSLDVRGEGTREARLRMSAGEAMIPGTFVSLGDPPITLYGQLRLLDFVSPPAVIIFVFRTWSDLVWTVFQDHLTICKLRV